MWSSVSIICANINYSLTHNLILGQVIEFFVVSNEIRNNLVISRINLICIFFVVRLHQRWTENHAEIFDFHLVDGTLGLNKMQVTQNLLQRFIFHNRKFS